MIFYKRKLFKSSLAAVVILSLILQALPNPKPAQASLKGILEAFLSITPEKIGITDDGKLKIGDFTLIGCLARDRWGRCVNPFSEISLGSWKTPLKDEQGRLLLPRPKIPELCELKVPLPEKQGSLPKEEKLALSKACSSFRLLSRAAANQVYFAKKIYNATDPLSDCFFGRTCKSNCYLRFGKVVFTVSIFDILSLFLPMGWVNVVRKIFNIAMQINQLRLLFQRITQTLQAAITFVNDLFAQLAYLKTFLEALGRVIKVVKEEGLKKILGHFAGNLIKFSQAKSAAIRLANDGEKETENLREKLKQEEGVRFLFEDDSAERDKLQKILDDYLANVGTTEEIIKKLINIGQFLDGPPGNVAFSCPEKAEARGEEIRCQKTAEVITIPPDCSFDCQTIQGQCSGRNTCGECVFRYPIEIGEHHFSEPFPGAKCSIVKGDLFVQCSGQCTAFCPAPTGGSDGWFATFRELYDKAKEVNQAFEEYKECVSHYPRTIPGECQEAFLDPETLELIDEITGLQTELDRQVRQLPPTTDEITGEIEPDFWGLEEKYFFALPLEQAQEIANNLCGYGGAWPYQFWAKKVANIVGTDLFTLRGELDKTLEKGRTDEYWYNDEFFEEFLATPLVNVQIDGALEKLVNVKNSTTNPEILDKIGKLENNLEEMKPNFSELERLWVATRLHTEIRYVEDVIRMKEISQELALLIDDSQNLIVWIRGRISNEDVLWVESFLNWLGGVVGHYSCPAECVANLPPLRPTLKYIGPTP